MAYTPFSSSVVSFQSDPTKLLTHASVSGNLTLNPTSVAVLQGTNPWIISNTSVAVMSVVPHSVAALQGTNPWAVQLTSGSIVATINNSSVMLTPGINTIGSVAAIQGTNPWVIGNSSVMLTPGINAIGSVAALQGTNPWVIAGTFNEDSASTGGDRGMHMLGVRNDTVASTTSASGDYNSLGVDSAGRILTKPFSPEESRVEGYNSVVSTSVTTLVAAAGAGLKNYITDIQVANTGSSTTLITFRSGGGTSVLGYTVAPTGGGSNINFLTPMRTLANETFDFQPTTASSIVYVTVKGFKAP